MLLRGWAGALLLLAACSNPNSTASVAPSAHPPIVSAPTVAEPVKLEQPPAEPAKTEPQALDYKQVVVRQLLLRCSDKATQGGAIVCRAPADSTLALDGKPVAKADRDGIAVIGLTRDQKSPAVISMDIKTQDGAFPTTFSVPVAERHDTVTKFEMECAKIAPQSEADKKKADISWTKKQKALKKFNDPVAPVAFEGPVTLQGVVYSSSFGATRTYVPKTKDCEPTTSVHNGTDIAVGKGTEIHAPMAGTVILADPDLFFEGGCVFLDLGRGLVSVTMHMSRIDVKAGQVVKQGDLLGLSGATGRVTGPHLHWAIKYRNVFSEDRGTDIWLDPMLVMKLKAPE
ncbi:MAG TPA: M23 family metallopeptidase [Hyphomonadaceae bacterium]|nr:M23 family metallopeptidase [Hyphomonadaceae bacterium]